MFNGVPRSSDVGVTYFDIPLMESIYESDYRNERVDMHYSISMDTFII